MTERNEPESVTYDDIFAVGRTGAPPILITVRSVEDSPSLQEIAVPVNTKSQRAKGGVSDVRKLDGLVAQGRPSGLRSAHDGSLCVNKRLRTQLVAKCFNTFPMVARPRPPLAAHSSLATRSSLVGRMARQREVTF